MEFVQMKCPNCGADLEVEDSIDSFYCKYCGTKILVEGQSKHVVNAKTKLRIMDRLADMQKEYHRQKEEAAKRQAEEARKVLPWILGLFLFLFAVSMAMAYLGGAFQ